MIFKYSEFLNERIKYTDDFILIKMKNLFFYMMIKKINHLDIFLII